MAEYVTVMRELQRMCNKNKCAECPITKTRHECVNCHVWMGNHPEEVDRIVMQWAAEHPIKTNRDKFKEVFGVEYYDLLLHGYSEWLTEEYKGGQDDKQ